MMAKAQDRQQKLFLGRDESWLSFNRRVLEEAQDDANPLLERVKFLAITASNLDEFVEIRVASILQRIEDGYSEPTPDGLTLNQSLAAITEDVHNFVTEQGHCWNQQLQPALRAAGVRVLGWDEMDDAARKAATAFYQREADPLLTPITIDPRHPFPRVLNKALCIALLLKRKRKGPGATGPVLGVVTVPRALPRLVPLPSSEGTHDFVFLHDVIERNAAGMYRGYEILSKAAFRVTRNSNLYFQEEESRSLKQRLEAMGPVNMMALEEYNETAERHGFLETQRKDLLDSIENTQQSIKEIDDVSRVKFDEAYKVINENFSNTFTKLFGGGQASMKLTDAENSAESGIDILASPPGKKLQNILLLSGGEKALTALSLLVGIFQFQPAPFCILDEVDAPLDETNVGRFAKLIHDMSATTQFVVITHSKRTMSQADVIYGVTMQEPGVSKIVSVNLNRRAVA